MFPCPTTVAICRTGYPKAANFSDLAPARLATRLHLQKLRTEKALTAGQEFARADRHLDRAAAGPLWRKDARSPSASAIASNSAIPNFAGRSALFRSNGNHVHLLLRPKIELEQITRNLKGHHRSLLQSNPSSHQTTFLAAESYDHWCRDDSEFQRIRGYIARNPVKAGLVAKPEEWPWSSAHRLNR